MQLVKCILTLLSATTTFNMKKLDLSILKEPPLQLLAPMEFLLAIRIYVRPLEVIPLVIIHGNMILNHQLDLFLTCLDY